jgi:hypothetical protein
MFQMRVAEDVAFECVLKRFRSSGDFEGGELIWSAESTNAQADVAGRGRSSVNAAVKLE